MPPAPLPLAPASSCPWPSVAPGRQRAPPGPLLTSSLSCRVCTRLVNTAAPQGSGGQAAPAPTHSSRPEGPSMLAAWGLALCAGQRWIHPAGLLWALGLNHIDGWQSAGLSEPRNSSWEQGICKHRGEPRAPRGAIPEACCSSWQLPGLHCPPSPPSRC